MIIFHLTYVTLMKNAPGFRPAWIIKITVLVYRLRAIIEWRWKMQRTHFNRINKLFRYNIGPFKYMYVS